MMSFSMAQRLGTWSFFPFSLAQAPCFPSLNSVSSLFLLQSTAKKTGCQCFVSVNLPDRSLLPLVEATIANKLQTTPTIFYNN